MSNTGVDPAGVNVEERKSNNGGRVKVGLSTSPSTKPDAPTTIRTQSIMRQVGGRGSIRRANEIQKVLSELDRDHDGTIDVAELIDMVEGIVKSRRERRYMWFVIIALFVFAACTIGTIIGLTYAVVDALKDTEVNGSVMYVKGSVTDVVKVGSADFAVVNNVMVPRSAAEAATPTNITNPTSVMQTAAFAGIRQPLSSRLPVETLFELKFLHIKGVGEVELGVNVNGVARVPLAGSVYGTVVRMITAAGTITLDGTVLTFSSQVADIFEEAGFRVSGSRRALVGQYYVFGFFNAIADLTPFGLPSGQAKPALPDTDYIMNIQVYQPCMPPGAPEDQCTYAVPPAVIDLTGRRLLAAEAGSSAVARRSAQDADELRADIPGVVTDASGTRWMAHNETVVSWKGKVRTESYFVPYPGYRMVELNDGTSDAVQIWQEAYEDTAPLAVLGYMFCRSSDLPAGAKGMRLSNYVLNFTYEGVDELRPQFYARHFVLTAKQPSTDELLTVDYWDTTDTDNFPVRFDVKSSLLGTVRMDVTSFEKLSASSAEVSAMRWSKPTTCPVETTIPKMTSPFTMRTGAVFAGSALHRRNALEQYDDARRVLQSSSCASGKVIDLYSGSFGPCSAKLSATNYIFLNGSLTCSGSLSVLDLSGSMTGNLCEMKADGCIQLDIRVPSNWLTNLIRLTDFTPFKACAVYDPNAKFFTIQGTAQANLGIAKADADFILRVSACCIWIETASDGRAARVVTIDGYLYNIFKGGWYHAGSWDVLAQTYLRGSADELSKELSVNASNINSWITVGEGFAGAWMDQKLCATYEYSSGSPAKITYGAAITSYQLRMDSETGSGDKTALNGVKLGCSGGATLTPTEGLTGTWTATAACPDNGKFNAARMRIEAKKTGADNTAANSLAFKCESSGAEVVASEGYAGDYTEWATCPSGTYICGLQVRYQGNQFSGDDTAINGAKIACCNPVTTPSSSVRR
ncbi:hypothetical protein GPECTOR_24g274 [Gonium pectorale]|uniref:EF-hand domain-containing protein n=1 Tax=Gonium pectorale TaxID=33097 RepID=A0A150GGP4_GONPE|nr:hypothetical protein GPECTOR_24g274 [Gonium pectorale]|eukprot:KXZ48984.1 hypothetical protein GPECTOR_24g274 [Gonium pectorale]